jgi:hypothetical protein
MSNYNIIFDYIKNKYPRKYFFPLHEPNSPEKEYVLDAIDPTFASSVGTYVNKFELMMPNLNAALACAQLEQLDSFIENKRELAKQYNIFFSSKGFKFRTELPQY